jgi:hypothetical protein
MTMNQRSGRRGMAQTRRVTRSDSRGIRGGTEFPQVRVAGATRSGDWFVGPSCHTGSLGCDRRVGSRLQAPASHRGTWRSGCRSSSAIGGAPRRDARLPSIHRGGTPPSGIDHRPTPAHSNVAPSAHDKVSEPQSTIEPARYTSRHETQEPGSVSAVTGYTAPDFDRTAVPLNIHLQRSVASSIAPTSWPSGTDTPHSAQAWRALATTAEVGVQRRERPHDNEPTIGAARHGANTAGSSQRLTRHPRRDRVPSSPCGRRDAHRGLVCRTVMPHRALG